MLKREIVYEDFNGNTVSESFYFNLSKSELVELEVSEKMGFEQYIQRIIEAKDHKTLIAEFKKIILLTYGVKSEDGKRFIKSDELRQEFSQTAAYDALFMELSTHDGAAATFIKGIVPKDLADNVEATGPKTATEMIEAAQAQAAAGALPAPGMPPMPPKFV